MPRFGEALTQLRTARELTLADLAQEADVSIFTLSRGVKSETCPWRSTVRRRIKDALERRLPFGEDESQLAFDVGLITRADVAGITAPTPAAIRTRLFEHAEHGDLHLAFWRFLQHCTPHERSLFEHVGWSVGTYGVDATHRATSDAIDSLRGKAKLIVHETKAGERLGAFIIDSKLDAADRIMDAASRQASTRDYMALHKAPVRDGDYELRQVWPISKAPRPGKGAGKNRRA